MAVRASLWVALAGALGLWAWSRTAQGSAFVSEAVQRIAELPLARRREIFRPLFESASLQYALPAGLLLRQAEVESSLNPLARGAAGELGIMQIIPRWHPELGEVGALDPGRAIPYAAKLLRTYRDRFGSWTLALAAYNAGPTAVSQYEGVPPFGVTRNYIAKILPSVGIVEQGVRYA